MQGLFRVSVVYIQHKQREGEVTERSELRKLREAEATEILGQARPLKLKSFDAKLLQLLYCKEFLGEIIKVR